MSVGRCILATSISLLYLASTQWAYAANAVSGLIELDQPGGTMQYVSTRDQSINLDCFAVSAVEMIDAWRFSHGDKNTSFQTSALVVAARANSMDDGNELGQGETLQQAILALALYGACSENATFEALGTFDTNTIVGILKIWKSGTSPYYSLGVDDPTYASWIKSRNLYPAIEGLVCQGDRPDLLPNEEFLKYVFMNVDPGAQLTTILSRACTGANHLDLRSWQLLIMLSRVDTSNQSPTTIVQEIGSMLTGPQSQPIGIKYCDNVLYSPAYKANGNVTPDCEMHESLVIGKRIVDGTPQFLIRNSWGNDCNGVPVGACDGKGDFWIDGNSLASNIFELTQLQPPTYN